jgi:hypothetical protein
LEEQSRGDTDIRSRSVNGIFPGLAQDNRERKHQIEDGELASESDLWNRLAGRRHQMNKSAPEGEAEHEGACKGGDEVGWREDIAVQGRMDGGCRRIWRREGGVRIGD